MEPNEEQQLAMPEAPQYSALQPALPVHQPNPFFFGRFGLRAGYGILIFLVLYALIAFLSGTFAIGATGQMHAMTSARAWNQAHPNGPKHHFALLFTAPFTIINEGVCFLAVLGICFFFSRAERRPLRSYGLGSYRVTDFLPGAFWGLVLLSAVVAVLHAQHLLVFDNRNVYGAPAVGYGLAWLLAFLGVGFAEEYAFRGYIQYTLMRGLWGLAERISTTHTRTIAFWIAGGLWSIMFGVAHLGNGGENAFGLVQVVLAGIVFTYALWRTGSLWWGVGYHMTWDWAQSFLFGVADSGNISIGRLFVTHPQGKEWLSGGAAGPEGSIFATVALILTVVVLRFTTTAGAQPAIEQQPPAQPELHSVVA